MYVSDQVVQSYGTETLLGLSGNIADIREYHMRPGRGDRPLLKHIQQYPDVDESELETGLMTPGTFTRLFGKQAVSVRNLLLRRGYCRSVDDQDCALTWKFRNIAVDDFDLGMSSSLNARIHGSLDSLLWTALPEGETRDRFLRIIRGEDEYSDEPAFMMGGNEYWFRQGNLILSFRFRDEPSPELLKLIDLKLETIQHEKMQNYFHIISSFNSDAAMWMSERNRSRRFFEIIEQLISYTWRPFDMESCEVNIDAASDEGLIASGYLKVVFSEHGVVASHLDGMDRRFPSAHPGGREFVVNDVALRAADHTAESSVLSLRMISRTTGNVDPRRNMLTHRFVKLFMESVGKLIDVIMPVIRREEALQNLKWNSFLDTLRLQSLSYGEDLHRILTESLKVLRRFYGINGVCMFSEDREIGNMLDLFARKDIGETLYTILENPLLPADLLRKQLVVFPIREIRGGRILLYFELPRIGNRPRNPEIPDQYLMGTDLWRGVHEEAAIMGLTDLKDYLFFLVTECLTPNPKGVIDALNRRLPVRNAGDDLEKLMKLSRKIMDRYSQFFDLFRALSGNLESGLAYMRGRRDNLTGLYNRQHFTVMLNEFYLKPGYRFGLMFLDMDNFKIFNDAVSHDFGDKILISVANRILEASDVMDNAVPGRFGGDEFCFTIGDIEKDDLQEVSIRVFRGITERPVVVSFYFDDRAEGAGMEINLIAFLHRLMRPDVGSRQASRTEYVEKPHMSPKNHVIDVWRHYLKQKGMEVPKGSIKSEQIIELITSEIEDKIIYNKIFSEIDQQIHRIIRLFVLLQIKDYTTNRLRDYLISEIGSLSIERDITLKVSAGIAHSTENRLRSMESLFKAADGRAYLAKHNGRNCLFGIDGRKLA